VAEYGYTVIYEPLSEGGYQVIVPALPGIVTYGRALEEAREMARDAILCHLRGLLKDGEEIPQDPIHSRAAAHRRGKSQRLTEKLGKRVILRNRRRRRIS